jgi:hypothetical protein
VNPYSAPHRPFILFSHGCANPQAWLRTHVHPSCALRRIQNANTPNCHSLVLYIWCMPSQAGEPVPLAQVLPVSTQVANDHVLSIPDTATHSCCFAVGG